MHMQGGVLERNQDIMRRGFKRHRRSLFSRKVAEGANYKTLLERAGFGLALSTGPFLAISLDD